MTRSRQTADWGSRAGLAKIVPSSVAVGSGTGSADSLGTVTFTTVSSVSLNDVFSSTYRKYKIIYDASHSTGSSIALRYRVGGADDSTSNYIFQIITGQTSTASASRSASQTSSNICGSAGVSRAEILVDNPNLAVNTFSLSTSFAGDGDLRIIGGHFNATTVFTGFTLIPSAGTITGTITVYGLN